MKPFHAPARALALLAALSLLPACKRGDANAPPVPHRPRVALVMKSLANEFFQTMEAGARIHQKTHAGRYELISNGIKDEQDVGKQIDLIDQMVARGADAIVLAPADSQALIAAVGRALDAGVVVINIDNRLDPAVLAQKNLRVPFVGPSNRKGAALAGKQLAARLSPGARVAIIEGLPTAENAQQRRLGFEDAIKSAGLALVAVQAGNWEMARANQVVAALLSEHPRLEALLCANDSMAMGAVAALRAAGRLHDVKVIGFDNISAVQSLIRQGEIFATVEQHADQLAVRGIEYALELLATGTRPADRETPVEVVTLAELSR